MVRHYLEFEKPIVELEDEIEHLKRFSRDKQIHFSEKLKGLEEKLQRLQKEIYSTLSAWQITQLARHIDRPKASHYLRRMFDSFVELHGDRSFGDDPAIVGGTLQIQWTIRSRDCASEGVRCEGNGPSEFWDAPP